MCTAWLMQPDPTFGGTFIVPGGPAADEEEMELEFKALKDASAARAHSSRCTWPSSLPPGYVPAVPQTTNPSALNEVSGVALACHPLSWTNMGLLSLQPTLDSYCYVIALLSIRSLP